MSNILNNKMNVSVACTMCCMCMENCVLQKGIA